ncbi:MAG: hypothetical protein Q9225_006211 [Loekoesia sp. 1 TL-2023]
MHDALSVGRMHSAKGNLVGYFDYHLPNEGGRKEERGERPVVVEKPVGQHIRTMGRADREGRLWLLPEEVVYLVERGSLDVRYRSASPMAEDGRGVGEEEEGGGEDWQDRGIGDENEAGCEWDDVSLSLQACYAWFIGRDGLSLERYTVYAGLRRSGYIVLRAPGWYENDDDNNGRLVMTHQGREQKKEVALSIWQWLYKNFLERKPRDPPPLGPLVGPGLYRSYSTLLIPTPLSFLSSCLYKVGDVYRLLHLIPYHDPSQATTNIPPPTSSSKPSASPPLRPHFHVYKPSPTFRKSAPGTPDFHITVLSAREDYFPTLSQLDSLLQNVPYAPPPENETRSYQRLKHGYRNVVLAIVDQGVVSYMRVADAGFGLEKMYERGVGRAGQGKRGGGGGKRGHKGGGRGRGR